MNLTPDYISNVIEDQFPEFFREQNSDVVALVMAYFEYLEQENKTSLKFSSIKRLPGLLHLKHKDSK